MRIHERIARAGLAATLVLSAAACEDGLTEANVNGNSPQDVSASLLLPEAIFAAVDQTFESGQMLSHTAIWPQQGVQIQYPSEEQGQVRSDRMQGYWDTYYAGPLKDIQLVINKGSEAGSPDIEGVGLIWKSWIFHIVTDLWGDVPYSEALQGEDGMTTPAYDAQSDIYAGLLQTLEDAAVMLEAGGEGFGSADILYENDFDKWIRFANSLRMRLAMRLSEVDEATARAEFEAAYNAPHFESNADNAMLVWPGSPYRNPLFEDWQGRDDHGISATMVDTLKSLADPRLELYSEPAPEDDEIRGLANGYRNPPLTISNYSRIGDFWRADGAATPTALLTYSEVKFLEAEAAARGWIAGDPAALYEAAIRANMEQYAAADAPTAAEIDAYLAQPNIVYTGIDQIHLQKWISLFMNGSEAWANWRRTDVPQLDMGPDLALSRIPVRFNYPALEQSLNAANLQAALDRQGESVNLVTPVWWDVK